MPNSPDRLDRFCAAIGEQLAWRNGTRPAHQRISVEPVAGAILVQGGRCVLLVAPRHEIAALDSDRRLHQGVNARLASAIRDMEDLVPEEGVRNSEYLTTQCIPIAVGIDLEPVRSGGPA